MSNTIILRCKEDNKTRENLIDRNSMEAVFEGLAKGFEEVNDNEISKRILSLLPNTREIFINKDINKNETIPYITMKEANGKKKMVKIMRNHKIVWAILNKYCEPEEL